MKLNTGFRIYVAFLLLVLVGDAAVVAVLIKALRSMPHG